MAWDLKTRLANLEGLKKPARFWLRTIDCMWLYVMA
jgi:hypothetical protein